MRRLLGRFFPCKDGACMLHRWHAGAHYRCWPNGTWQMWTDYLDFGFLPRKDVSYEEARTFIESFNKVTDEGIDTP